MGDEQIDTPEEIDAAEATYEHKLNIDGVILIVMSLTMIAIGAWWVLHPGTIQDHWNALLSLQIPGF